MPRGQQNYRRRNPVYDTVDWTLPDAEIARQVGVCRERIRQVRKAHNLQDSPMKGQWVNSRRRRLLRAIGPENLNSEPAPVLLERVNGTVPGAKVSDVRDLRHLTGQQVPKPVWTEWQRQKLQKHPFDLLDWTLPNQDLAEIWHLHYFTVTNHRAKFRLGASRWQRNWGKVPDDPEYQQRKAAQEAAAQEWFKNPSTPAEPVAA